MTRTPHIPTPPGGLTTQMKREVQAFVANAIQEHAQQTAEFVAEVLRQNFAQCVTMGLFTPEGVARVQAAQEIARAQAEAAQAAGVGVPSATEIEGNDIAESPDPDPGHQSGIVLVH